MTQYMTSEQLKISPEEHAGLIKLAAHLAKDPVKHVSDDDDSIATSIWDQGGFEKDGAIGFNMSYQIRPLLEEGRKEYHCGSVACIGGHLSLMLQGVDALSPEVSISMVEANIATKYVNQFDAEPDMARSDEPMAALFYPYSVSNWGQITPQQAASAIVNFLTTGKPGWTIIAPELANGDED